MQGRVLLAASVWRKNAHVIKLGSTLYLNSLGLEALLPLKMILFCPLVATSTSRALSKQR